MLRIGFNVNLWTPCVQPVDAYHTWGNIERLAAGLARRDKPGAPPGPACQHEQQLFFGTHQYEHRMNCFHLSMQPPLYLRRGVSVLRPCKVPGYR